MGPGPLSTGSHQVTPEERPLPPHQWAPLRSIKETFRTGEARSSSSRSPSNHFQGMFFLRRILRVSSVSRQDCAPCHSHASYPSTAQTAPLWHSVLLTAFPFAAALDSFSIRCWCWRPTSHTCTHPPLIRPGEGNQVPTLRKSAPNHGIHISREVMICKAHFPPISFHLDALVPSLSRILDPQDLT